MSEQKLQARVYSRTAPTEEQLAQLRDFLHQKYQRPVNLHWERDDRMKDGFRLELGEGESRELVYDWSSSGKSRQLKDKIAAAIRSRSDVIPLLRKTLEDFQPEASATEIGTVLSYGDGIAEVSGLPGAEYGEILIFENGVRGMVLDLKEKSIGCVVFAGEAAVQAGSVVLRSGRSAGIPVGDAFLGRVIDPLGAPIDGKGKISESDYYPIEAPPPASSTASRSTSPCRRDFWPSIPCSPSAAASANSSSATAKPARRPLRSTRSSTRRIRTSCASMSPSARRRRALRSSCRRCRRTTRCGIPSSSARRPAIPRRCSTSLPTQAARWANTSCIRGATC